MHQCSGANYRGEMDHICRGDLRSMSSGCPVYYKRDASIPRQAGAAYSPTPNTKLSLPARSLLLYLPVAAVSCTSSCSNLVSRVRVPKKGKHNQTARSAAISVPKNQNETRVSSDVRMNETNTNTNTNTNTREQQLSYYIFCDVYDQYW